MSISIFGGGGGALPAGTIVVDGKILSPTGLIILTFQNQGVATTGTSAKRTDPLTGLITDYVVPVGKTFVMHAIKCEQLSASAADHLYWRLAYGDTVILDAGVVNPIGMISGVAPNLQDTPFGAQIIAGAAASKERACYGRVPTGKYPTIYVASNGGVALHTMYGYEV